MQTTTAKRLKALRVKLGLSMRELASELNINYSSICYYESGKREPSITTCYKYVAYAKLCGIDINVEWVRPQT